MTGNDCFIFKLLRPEWVREKWFESDDVGAIDAPERIPAGSYFKYEPMFHGKPFPMQSMTFRSAQK